MKENFNHWPIDMIEAYKCLGLDPNNNPTLDSIKKAWKKKSLQHHPDRNPSENATKEMQAINKAYSFLIKIKGTGNIPSTDPVSTPAAFYKNHGFSQEVMDRLNQLPLKKNPALDDTHKMTAHYGWDNYQSYLEMQSFECAFDILVNAYNSCRQVCFMDRFIENLAQKIAQELLDIYPVIHLLDQVTAFLQQGSSQEKQSRWNLAIFSYQQAIDCIEKGRKDSPQVDKQKAFFSTKLALLHNLIGLNYSKLKENVNAKAAFTSAVDCLQTHSATSEQYQIIVGNLAYCCYQLQDWQGVVTYYGKIIKTLHPDKPLDYLDYSQYMLKAYRQLGQWQAMIALNQSLFAFYQRLAEKSHSPDSGSRYKPSKRFHTHGRDEIMTTKAGYISDRQTYQPTRSVCIAEQFKILCETARCHMNLKQWDKAENSFQQAVKFANQLSYDDDSTAFYHDWAFVLLCQNKAKPALDIIAQIDERLSSQCRSSAEAVQLDVTNSYFRRPLFQWTINEALLFSKHHAIASLAYAQDGQLKTAIYRYEKANAAYENILRLKENRTEFCYGDGSIDRVAQIGDVLTTSDKLLPAPLARNVDGSIESPTSSLSMFQPSQPSDKENNRMADMVSPAS